MRAKCPQTGIPDLLTEIETKQSVVAENKNNLHQIEKSILQFFWLF